jgi:hypothetical protein
VLYDGVGGNDTLTGGAGNDMLTGGAGNDVLVGDTGADVSLVYSTPTFGRVTAVGADLGKLTVSTEYDGTDTLSGVEVVRQMTVPIAAVPSVSAAIPSVLVKQFVLVDGAQNLQKAIDAAVTGDVVVTSGSLTITVAQANAMLAKGASFHTGDVITISDTADHILHANDGVTGTPLFAANTGAVASALNIDAVSANNADGNVGSLDVATTNKLLARVGNDSALKVSLTDTAENIAGSASTMNAPGVIAVSVTTAATVAQANTIHAANPSVVYDVTDTAANIVDSSGAARAAVEAGARVEATAGTVGQELTVTQAAALKALTVPATEGVTPVLDVANYNVADSASAFVGATPAQADAINGAVAANVSNPTAVGTLNVAEATKLLALGLLGDSREEENWPKDPGKSDG